jgi:hypothetical protein
MKPRLDKYEVGYQSFAEQKALYLKAVDWDEAVTSSTVYREGQPYLVSWMKKTTIGDQLRDRQSLKVSIHVTNYSSCAERIVTLSQWINEGWTVAQLKT